MTKVAVWPLPEGNGGCSVVNFGQSHKSLEVMLGTSLYLLSCFGYIL